MTVGLIEKKLKRAWKWMLSLSSCLVIIMIEGTLMSARNQRDRFSRDRILVVTINQFVEQSMDLPGETSMLRKENEHRVQ